MKFLIVDDDTSFANELKDILVPEFNSNLTIDIVTTYNEDTPVYDVYLLDYEMPKKDGLTIAKEIKAKNPNAIIIFVTWVKDISIDAHDLNALHFLWKKEYKKKIDITVSRIKKHFEEQILTLTFDDNTILTKLVTHITKKGKDTIVHTIVEDYPTRLSIKEINMLLPSEYFGIVRNSCMVNFKHLEHVDKKRVVVKNTSLNFSRNKYDKFMEKYLAYIGNS